MPRVFLPEAGFREAGVRLARPAQAVADGRALTVQELIATPEGIDLAYEIAYDAPSHVDARSHESIIIRIAGHTTELGRRAVALSSRDGVWRRAFRSQIQIPTNPGPVEVDIALSDLGAWRVAGQLVAFGQDAESKILDASDTQHGITVRLRSVSISSELTAVELDASAEADGRKVEGIGGSHTRFGPSSFVLWDQELRQYREQPHDVRLDTLPYDHETFAVFPPLDPAARRLALEVPFVCIYEPYEQLTFEIPVTTPRSHALGQYAIRVLRTFTLSAGSAAVPRSSAPGVAIDIDFGGWQGSRRVLAPRSVLVDGAAARVGYINRFDMRSPEPVQQFAA